MFIEKKLCFFPLFIFAMCILAEIKVAFIALIVYVREL